LSPYYFLPSLPGGGTGGEVWCTRLRLDWYVNLRQDEPTLISATVALVADLMTV